MKLSLIQQFRAVGAAATVPAEQGVLAGNGRPAGNLPGPAYVPGAPSGNGAAPAGNGAAPAGNGAVPADPAAVVRTHLAHLAPALACLEREAGHLAEWGQELARRLMAGQRLLAAGNGGSAAEAQHLTAELVGRFKADRRPFSAIALHADTSAVTAIGNDYGYGQVFARQVAGHIRPGDILLLLSTSGKSENLLQAAAEARRAGALSWALTGAGPNPLAGAVDDVIAIEALSANVQEAHLVALHAICHCFDAEVARLEGTS
jgi:D-sedoheptulose 7-phosphate isomerase